MTAGQKLRADLDAPLRHASAEPGRELEFDEAELVRKPEPRPTALLKLFAEIRPCEKQAVDFTARVKHL
jgi:hypothetical protein